MGDSPGSRANNMYSVGSDKSTEVQLYMSTLYHTGSPVIRAIPGVEKPFLFSNLAVKAAKSEYRNRLFNVAEGSD